MLGSARSEVKEKELIFQIAFEIAAQIAIASSLKYENDSTHAITVLKGESDLLVDSVVYGADPSATFIS